ncbi:MAG: fibrobacter succinogenes major paralogous domain-containing protein [Ferruginibacter sp.]
MKKEFFIVSAVILVCFTHISWTISNRDLKEKKYWAEVRIGNQTWMAENLNVCTFRNGDTIQEAKTLNEWRSAAKKKIPAWCYFNNDSSNGLKHGKMYNFYPVNDSRGLAPINWRIPSGEDWKQLSNYLGGKLIAGGKMKSTSGWHANGNGTNSSGFNGYASGSRELAMITKNEGFLSLGSISYWWSSTKDKRTNEVLVFSVSWNNNKLLPIWDTFSSDGYAVRCIKN